MKQPETPLGVTIDPFAIEPPGRPPRPRVEPIPGASWRPVDLAALLFESEAGDLAPLEPDTFRRADGICLLYPGRVHAFIGESETGKSWAAQVAATEVLLAGGTVLYVDFESEARDVVGHLVALGVPLHVLASRLVYIRPDEPLSPAVRSQLLATLAGRELDLAVLDGVDEAMAAGGLDPSSRKDYITWHRSLVRPLQLAARGPLVLIDHQVKNREQRGDWAGGTVGKKTVVDGAMFVFEVVQPLGRGRTGVVRLAIAKDRPGALRRHAGNGREIARLQLASAGDDLTAELLAPVESEDGDQAWQPTALMEKVSRLLEESEPLSGTAIEKRRLGRAQYVRAALEALVSGGYVRVAAGPRKAQLHSSIRPFREQSEPSQEALELDPVPPRPTPSNEQGPYPSTTPSHPASALNARSGGDGVVERDQTPSDGVTPSRPDSTAACPSCGDPDGEGYTPVGAGRLRCLACGEEWSRLQVISPPA